MEESKLSLRKKNLNNIISSKRKLIFENETDSKVDEEYVIDIKKIVIPEEFKIDINKFYENVIIYII
jgi:hypothetical protein